jgi:hypothetical protein
MDERVIRNGDIWDLGQTVNGVSRFAYINNKWYYYETRTTSDSEELAEYEYDHHSLFKAVIEDATGGWDECKRIGNIFDFDEVLV